MEKGDGNVECNENTGCYSLGSHEKHRFSIYQGRAKLCGRQFSCDRHLEKRDSPMGLPGRGTAEDGS